ncbi:MAG: SDR family oxidoreductase [Anaerolineae bacterium]
MRVLITGATGFIGANLARTLVERGEHVRILCRSTSRLDALEGLPVQRVVGDILDPDSLCAAMQGCALVFHVAAVAQYWRNHADWVYRVNVEGTRNVVRAALRCGAERLVYTSSSAAIGPAPHPNAPVDETQRFPEALHWFVYGHSKHLAEQEVQRGVEQGLSAVIVNPTIVLGPGDLNFVSGSTIRAAVRGQLRILPPGGSNLVHVQDVVAGHVAAAERGRTGERYILGGENLTHRRAAQIIAEVTGAPPPLLTLPAWCLPVVARLIDAFNTLTRTRDPLVTGDQVRLGDKYFYYNCAKAIRELGVPQTPFRQAVADAWHWYRAHKLL